ncbi:sugar kinase [Runella slithyformis]|uniref:PfkB domain protein n=1 Tax=Runella slithyformis (strain ATCC 29530 / DSM 19594 / LMG 11500 / NCIMB 11436 / LSU 4) TaxID=761193 RepID=A0A7U3ZK82_RUNSL|nr:sugar kinase [Runella slithyformis]AEI48696.1 PfkB domain protein [Runella slithyformis DSM 19594]
MSTGKTICCFGELLLRFSPQLNGEWINRASMPVFIGGAELNVANALANWKVPVRYSTVLPENQLSTEIKAYIEEKGIETSGIRHFGSRIGAYYLPQGADLKNAGVIYDRAFSSFSELTVGKVDWEEVLKGCSWFHFSAISPALSQEVADACLEAVQVAARLGLTVSVDLNYRAKLWQFGKKPVEIMPALAQYCDVIMGNIWAANTLLGIPVDRTAEQNPTQEKYLAHSIATAEALQVAFPKCKVVAHTFRFDAFQQGIQYYTTLYKDGKQYVSPEFTTEKVVDKVGSGDCFMGGLIYGLSQHHAPQDIIDFAAAAAFGKLQEYGDASQQTVEDVNRTLQNVLSEN